MAKSSQKTVNQLLDTIGQTPTQGSQSPGEQREATPEPRRPEAQTKASPKPRRTSQIYFYPEDKKLIRELSAWFAGQGVRINDSLVIRSVLRAVERNTKLLEAYREASQLDDRFKNPPEVKTDF